jgi:cation:H+ antiporter
MILSIFLIAVGFALLIFGADWMVNGASTMARKNNVPDLVIGLTIVAFGTSAPELVVNSVASFQGYSDIVFGNIIGSNNFNLFFILGIVGLIFPIAVQSSTVWKEIPISFGAILAVFFLANSYFSPETNSISRIDGFFLLLMFALFLFYIYKQMQEEQPDLGIDENVYASNFHIWGLIIVGIGGLVLGGKLVVDNAISIATTLGVSEKIIGLTIVAAGTSLPELVTSVVAAFKKKSDIAIGNIIGSNIFNIFFILSISSLIRPIDYNPAFNTDLYILAGGTIFLFIAMFMGKKKKLDRWESAILLLFYLGYTVFLVSKEI